jgi:Uma2 family endonuclease
MHVLGTSTSAIDRAWKLEEYFRLPSMRQYLIVWADRQQGAHHRRTDQVSIETVTVMSGSARLGPPGIEIQVEDICAP